MKSDDLWKGNYSEQRLVAEVKWLVTDHPVTGRSSAVEVGSSVVEANEA